MDSKTSESRSPQGDNGGGDGQEKPLSFKDHRNRNQGRIVWQNFVLAFLVLAFILYFFGDNLLLWLQEMGYFVQAHPKTFGGILGAFIFGALVWYLGTSHSGELGRFFSDRHYSKFLLFYGPFVLLFVFITFTNEAFKYFVNFAAGAAGILLFVASYSLWDKFVFDHVDTFKKVSESPVGTAIFASTIAVIFALLIYASVAI